jgi:hypothetical protein
VSFTVSLTVSGVSVAVWVLDEAQVFVSGAVVAVVGAIVDDNTALAMGHSGCERRGWECCCGAVGRLSSICRCFRGVGSWFRVGDRVVVNDSVDAVDGGVDEADGGGASIDGGDEALAGVAS